MKKYLLTILLGACGIMVLATTTLAATNMSFTPVRVNVRQGQIFTLIVGVNPQGLKNYTAKAELRFPADLLEVKSFAFANSWMPLAQPGYDLTDNLKGTLIRTAGYPGGITAPTIFGTVFFRAKKNGAGLITLNNNSFALDANNQNVLANIVVQTIVAVSPPVVAPVTTPKPATVKVPTSTSSEEIPIVPVPEQPSAASSTPSPITARSLSASIGNLISLGTDNVIVEILVILIIAGAIYFIIVRRSHRPK
ncbi:MAG: hypothetical protein V1704_02825 [Candidatus Vogelbacteria bacterium]